MLKEGLEKSTWMMPHAKMWCLVYTSGHCGSCFWWAKYPFLTCPLWEAQPIFSLLPRTQTQVYNLLCCCGVTASSAV